MFKYNQRLERLKKCTESQNRILIAAKVENDYLQNSGSNFYWQKHLFILKDRLKLPSLDISSELFNGSLVSFYKENVKAELEQIKLKKNGKLYFYSQIINDYELQSYLKHPIKKSLRSSLTRLRISAHALEIEIGRYSRPPKPKEDRLCFYCKTLVEDELHFIYTCPLYQPLRSKQFPDICNQTQNSVNNDPTKLLNPENIIETKHICEFINTCFEERNHFRVSMSHSETCT